VGQLVLPKNAHARLRLRVPTGEQLTRVLVGSLAVTPSSSGTIDLGDLSGAVLVRATVD